MGVNLREHCTGMDAPEDIERLRAERDEWRRRAEVAEAVAAERLTRAETAERALRAAETAPPPATASAGEETVEPAPAQPAERRRPASLLERWRRYTDSLN